MKLAAALLLCGLTCCIAGANWAGCFFAMRRRRRGESGGYSNVPLMSILFAAGATYLGKDIIGYWAWLPAMLDPGTWMTAIAPFWIPWMMYRERAVPRPPSPPAGEGARRADEG